jgi:hypothetical protein
LVINGAAFPGAAELHNNSDIFQNTVSSTRPYQGAVLLNAHNYGPVSVLQFGFLPVACHQLGAVLLSEQGKKSRITLSGISWSVRLIMRPVETSPERQAGL